MEEITSEQPKSGSKHENNPGQQRDCTSPLARVILMFADRPATKRRYAPLADAHLLLAIV